MYLNVCQILLLNNSGASISGGIFIVTWCSLWPYIVSMTWHLYLPLKGQCPEINFQTIIRILPADDIFIYSICGFTMVGDFELFTYIKYFYNTIYSFFSIKKTCLCINCCTCDGGSQLKGLRKWRQVLEDNQVRGKVCTDIHGILSIRQNYVTSFTNHHWITNWFLFSPL